MEFVDFYIYSSSAYSATPVVIPELEPAILLCKQLATPACPVTDGKKHRKHEERYDLHCTRVAS